MSYPLLALAHTHPDEQMRRTAWAYLEQLGKRTHDVALTSRAVTALQRVGTQQQIARDRLHRLRRSVYEIDPDDVLIQLDALEREQSGRPLEWEARLLRADILEYKGEAEQARSLREQVLQGRPGTSVARQAREALDRPVKQESHP